VGLAVALETVGLGPLTGQLAQALAHEVRPFPVQSLGEIPLARYRDSGWLTKYQPVQSPRCIR
jgi:hypothetical protein